MDMFNSTPIEAGSPLHPDSLRTWFDERAPWQAGFLSLLRTISARDPSMPQPGTARLPREEPFRVGQHPSMAFAPREVAALDLRGGRLDVRLFGLGLWGPHGPLPLHMTELAYSRSESQQDQTLIAFANLFHHRALTLFYRAWASAQATVSLDRPEHETFSFYIGSLMGTDPAEAVRIHPPAHARYAASAHLVREARNPDGLAATLSHYFGVPVAVDEFVPHWIQVSRTERCLLGAPATSTIMGEGALLGDMIPDCQHKFRLVIGPLDLDQYLRLTPHGDDLPTLVDWVRAFVGYEYDWEIKLLVKPHAAPPARADSTHRLGYSTWLGESMDDEPVVGMVFDPEKYCDQLENSA
ncbi:type VI secretion protein, VC_A0111 family (plasmid) [Burkholderia ambifaria MC40-6]|uniref:Type VI secretion protein, VC_A0111 family n=1 Tax=Burkholderia ambifaria (strain MC40-6) TaxID=398577 RepID=B1Z6L5_BURA4|nr:type VI secretion system baseplate subunit TssG [Burkholderia ambifaria]ACB69092.1 type VI secretion protein, VC_A0111 family [Burkholderia ambifaria MC40-6]